MKCLNDQALRALIDREAPEPEREAASRHIEQCADCRARLERMSCATAETAKALAPLAPKKATGPPRAFERFQARLASDGGVPVRSGFVRGFFSVHPLPAWGGVATVALIIVLVMFAPARSWTQRVLAMLRVERVTVVPLDLKFEKNSDTQALVRKVISSDVTVTLSAGKPQFVSDTSQATQMAGFPVRTLGGMKEAPKIGVVGEQSYIMKLDQSRLQAIIDSLGKSDVQVPKSVDGQEIAVHVARSVFLRYGNCPEKHAGKKPGAEDPSPAIGTAGCVMFAEVPSPIVSVPPELNVEQLFQIALQAGGMSPEEARTFCSKVDWKSTLVVPIPRRASSYSEEQVDGVTGNLIMSKGFHGQPEEYTLIWVKDGIIYSIHGSGGPGQAKALAKALS
jgi:anti-sigma factor RsiW